MRRPIDRRHGWRPCPRGARTAAGALALVLIVIGEGPPAARADGAAGGVEVELDVRTLVVPVALTERLRTQAGEGDPEVEGVPRRLGACGSLEPARGPDGFELVPRRPRVDPVAGPAFAFVHPVAESRRGLTELVARLRDDDGAVELAADRVVAGNGETVRLRQLCEVPYRIVEELGADVASSGLGLDLALTPAVDPEGRVALRWQATNWLPYLGCGLEGDDPRLRAPLESGSALVPSGRILVIGGAFLFPHVGGCTEDAMAEYFERDGWAHLLVLVLPTVRGGRPPDPPGTSGGPGPDDPPPP